MKGSAQSNTSAKAPSVVASTGAPSQKSEPSPPSRKGSYRLSKSEFESMMQGFQTSGEWMKEQLEIDPDLKHL